MLSGGACCFSHLALSACVHDGCVHFVILHPPAPFFLHWKYVVNFECPHALLIGVVCRPITSSFRGLFLCGVFAQPFTAALIGVVISYCVALASGVVLDLAFSAPFSYLYLVLLPDGLSNVAHRWCSFLIYLFCLCPQPFSFHFFVGLLTHLSSASFLTISLFPKALCSYAASFCGVSLRLKLSLHTLVNGFFRPAPVNAIFSIFLFTLPPGAFYLTLPVVIHPFAFDRILFLEDLLAPLFQRRCITAHTAAGICKTRGLTSNWGQSSFDALFKPLKEIIS